jgi:insertion element IS1 protein InsB
MGLMPVLCPHGHSDQVIKGGKTKTGTQRYKCENPACPHYSFQLDLKYKGRLPESKTAIVAMSLNGSGIRDTARVLKIRPTTVINELQKSLCTDQCQRPRVARLGPSRSGSRYPTRG